MPTEELDHTEAPPGSACGSANRLSGRRRGGSKLGPMQAACGTLTAAPGWVARYAERGRGGPAADLPVCRLGLGRPGGLPPRSSDNLLVVPDLPVCPHEIGQSLRGGRPPGLPIWDGQPGRSAPTRSTDDSLVSADVRWSADWSAHTSNEASGVGITTGLITCGWRTGASASRPSGSPWTRNPRSMPPPVCSNHHARSLRSAWPENPSST